MNKKEELEKILKDIEFKIRNDDTFINPYLIKNNISDFNKVISSDIYSFFISDVQKISFGNKYALWIVKRYLNDGIQKYEDFGRVEIALSYFHRYKHRLEEKDRNIMNIKTLIDLENLVEPFAELDKQKKLEKLKKDEIYSETKFLYDGPEGKILVPLTQQSSIFWGQGTKWCTASTEYNMFDYYNEKGPLYIFITNQKDEQGREIKYQLHWKTNQFMNSEDYSILGDDDIKNNPPSIFSVFEKIKDLKRLNFAKGGLSILKYFTDIDSFFSENEKINLIKQNPLLIADFEKLPYLDKEIYLKAVEEEESVFKKIPLEFLDKEFYLSILKQNYICFKYVPEELYPFMKEKLSENTKKNIVAFYNEFKHIFPEQYFDICVDNIVYGVGDNFVHENKKEPYFDKKLVEILCINKSTTVNSLPRDLLPDSKKIEAIIKNAGLIGPYDPIRETADYEFLKKLMSCTTSSNVRKFLGCVDNYNDFIDKIVQDVSYEKILIKNPNFINDLLQHTEHNSKYIGFPEKIIKENPFVLQHINSSFKDKYQQTIDNIDYYNLLKNDYVGVLSIPKEKIDMKIIDVFLDTFKFNPFTKTFISNNHDCFPDFFENVEYYKQKARINPEITILFDFIDRNIMEYIKNDEDFLIQLMLSHNKNKKDYKHTKNFEFNDKISDLNWIKEARNKFGSQILSYAMLTEHQVRTFSGLFEKMGLEMTQKDICELSENYPLIVIDPKIELEPKTIENAVKSNGVNFLYLFNRKHLFDYHLDKNLFKIALENGLNEDHVEIIIDDPIYGSFKEIHEKHLVFNALKKYTEKTKGNEINIEKFKNKNTLDICEYCLENGVFTDVFSDASVGVQKIVLKTLLGNHPFFTSIKKDSDKFLFELSNKENVFKL